MVRYIDKLHVMHTEILRKLFVSALSHTNSYMYNNFCFHFHTVQCQKLAHDASSLCEIHCFPFAPIPTMTHPATLYLQS